MATFNQAIITRLRIQAAYPGVTCKLAPLSSTTYGNRVHDARASERKNSTQTVTLGGGNSEVGRRIAWSGAFDTAAIDVLYP